MIFNKYSQKEYTFIRLVNWYARNIEQELLIRPEGFPGNMNVKLQGSI